LSENVTSACGSGKHAFIFDGTHQLDLSAVSEKYDFRVASAKYGRTVWYAGEAGKNDFGKFLQATGSQ